MPKCNRYLCLLQQLALNLRALSRYSLPQVGPVLKVHPVLVTRSTWEFRMHCMATCCPSWNASNARPEAFLAALARSVSAESNGPMPLPEVHQSFHSAGDYWPCCEVVRWYVLRRLDTRGLRPMRSLKQQLFSQGCFLTCWSFQQSMKL